LRRGTVTHANFTERLDHRTCALSATYASRCPRIDHPRASQSICMVTRQTEASEGVWRGLGALWPLSTDQPCLPGTTAALATTLPPFFSCFFFFSILLYHVGYPPPPHVFSSSSGHRMPLGLRICRHTEAIGGVLIVLDCVATAPSVNSTHAFMFRLFFHPDLVSRELTFLACFLQILCRLNGADAL
jgi:hypothetical protein